MKIRAEHYDYMKKAISKIDKELIDSYAKAVKEPGKCKDFSKKMRWDLFYIARLSAYACDNMGYVNDTHIDTALRSIVKELNYNFN